MVRQKTVIHGYEQVAQFMSAHDEFAILRRFRALNMKSLLYLQAEILHLEEDLSELATRDTEFPGRRYHGRDWWSLANGQDEGDQEQWAKVLHLRETLAAYNDAVLKQAHLARLEDPSRHDLELMRTWLQRPSMGNFPLLGLDRTTWDKDHETDLVALRPRRQSDFFSNWVIENIVPKFHHFIGARFKTPDPLSSGLFTYDDNTLLMITFCVITTIASTLPILSVVLLYYVQSDTARLWLAMMLCACFTLVLGLMTNARRIDIFATTAAFAAVVAAFLTNKDGTC